ncbi:MAG: lipoyl(octanoyl) transferase LipB [Candidatus Eremiobacteraeota bacterium]|nr:lipoyl(octanoyl) transferase LipB [Candidatus Eremiobacteraeota bacterium]
MQRNIHASVARGASPQTWITVEHDPVITRGRNAKNGHILLSREILAERGVDVFDVERGGDVTYHGPGQLVVYPIRKLERFREVVPLVRALEGAVIAACARFGVAAQRWGEHAGVWVGDKSICALGLAVRQMTSLHGLALNVDLDLTYDRLITPCGLPERGITSLSDAGGSGVSMERARDVLLEELSRTFDVSFERMHSPEIALGAKAS